MTVVAGHDDAIISIMKNTSLADAYPEIAAQWHPTRNGDLTPKDVHREAGE